MHQLMWNQRGCFYDFKLLGNYAFWQVGRERDIWVNFSGCVLLAS